MGVSADEARLHAEAEVLDGCMGPLFTDTPDPSSEVLSMTGEMLRIEAMVGGTQVTAPQFELPHFQRQQIWLNFMASQLLSSAWYRPWAQAHATSTTEIAV